MEIVKSTDIITKIAIDSLKSQNKNHFVMLIGGCSRSGKTTFSKQLAQKIEENGLNTLIISIDSWLLSIEDRKKNSKVYERYDTEGIGSALNGLLNRKTIISPVYDPISRRRHKELKGESFHIQSGIIIFEGTITLSIKKLLQKSDLNIFVQTSDCTRLKRLLNFYANTKMLCKADYKRIILSREDEEIPFIKQSVQNAHFIFQS